MKKVQNFCEKLVAAKIDYPDLMGYINKIFEGRRLNDEEKKVGEVLSNDPLTHKGKGILDVNFVLDNKQEIRKYYGFHD